MLKSSFRMCFGLVLLAAGQQAMAQAPIPQDGSQVSQALSQLTSALQSDASLSPETRSALLGLTDALKAEKQQSIMQPASLSGTNASLIGSSLNYNAGCANGCTSGSGCDSCCPGLITAPGNTCYLNLYGDFRLRHESRYNSDANNRHRQRLRIRIGADFVLDENFKVGVRARSGNPNDQNSPHHTFGGTSSRGATAGFDSVEFNLDRAFAEWQPTFVNGLTVTGGKFSNPMVMNPVYSELVWDADISPEGVALVYVPENDAYRFVAGVYTIDENGGTDEVRLFTMQGSGKFDVDCNSTIEGSVGLYHYNDPTPGASVALVGDNAQQGGGAGGRNAIAGGQFVSDFHIIDSILAYRTTAYGLPLVASAQYIYNEGAGTDEDTGWAVGGGVGSTKSVGDWFLYYQYERIEQEAVFAAMVNDDFPLASNFTGHVVGLKYQAAKFAQIHLWALNGDQLHRFPGAQNREDWTLRADLNVKF